VIKERISDPVVELPSFNFNHVLNRPLDPDFLGKNGTFSSTAGLYAENRATITSDSSGVVDFSY
jgi:hypothetical protein